MTASLGFGVVTALNVLTKGIIGAIFPLAFVVVYLAWTHRLAALRRLHLLAGTAIFLLLAAPWHVLAALRNPPIAMPAGQGLPAHAGWAWFYLYNEHIGRFLGLRVPQDYGQTPIWLFWLYALIWVMPWAPFLPGAIASARHRWQTQGRSEATLTVTLWTLLVMLFFTLSSRQEYYSLPALPALALLAGRLPRTSGRPRYIRLPSRQILPPLDSAAHRNDRGRRLRLFRCSHAPARERRHPRRYAQPASRALQRLSRHVFDLTTQALGFFRGPLVAVAVGMIVLGPIAFLLRCRLHPSRRTS